MRARRARGAPGPAAAGRAAAHLATMNSLVDASHFSSVTFGLELELLRKGVSSEHAFALEAVTSAPGNAQRWPKALQSLVLGVPGRTFWRKFASLTTLREPYYVSGFDDIRPARGRQL